MITSVRHFQQVPLAPRRSTSWRLFPLRFVWRSVYAFVCTQELWPGSETIHSCYSIEDKEQNWRQINGVWEREMSKLITISLWEQSSLNSPGKATYTSELFHPIWHHMGCIAICVSTPASVLAFSPGLSITAWTGLRGVCPLHKWCQHGGSLGQSLSMH